MAIFWDETWKSLDRQKFAFKRMMTIDIGSNGEILLGNIDWQ